MSSDYYGVLGLTYTATSDEIKKQYKKLAIKYHPDKTQDKEHHQKFLLIREAYDTLKDEDLRQKYNREHGIGVLPHQTANFPSSRGFNYGAEHPSFSRHQHMRSSYGDSGFGSSFFDLYLRGSKMYSEHFSRTTQREAAQKKEEQDAFYAEYTRKKMQEDKERRQQEYIRNARAQKEKEQAQKAMEESMRRRNEEEAVHNTYSKHHGFGNARDEYEHAKMEAHRRAHEAEERYEYGYSGFPHHKGESAEFIVVDDEDPEQEEQTGCNGNHGNEEGEDEEDDGDDDDDDDEDDDAFLSGYEYAARFGGVKEEAKPGFRSEHANGHIFVDADEDSDGSRNTEEEDASLTNNENEEDEEIGEEIEEEESTNGFEPGIVPPTETADDYTNASFASEGTEYATPGPSRHKPEIVEVPEESDQDVTGNFFHQSSHQTSHQTHSHSHSHSHPHSHSYSRSNSHSPSRSRPSTSDFSERRGDPRMSAKKPRLANYDNMKDSLHTYLGDVDISDIRNELPDYSHRTRKASSSNAAQAPKRARYAEYTDGTSKAETLHTPVNKAYSRKSTGTISMSDLSPVVDDSSLLFSEELPTLTVHQDMTKTEWESYVGKIHEYERKFALYRKAVLEYQMGRLDKDERHHNIIYSDTSCLDVYLSCLFNDVLLLQNYTRVLQEFRQTLKNFHLNCETVNKMKA